MCDAAPQTLAAVLDACEQGEGGCCDEVTWRAHPRVRESLCHLFVDDWSSVVHVGTGARVGVILPTGQSAILNIVGRQIAEEQGLSIVDLDGIMRGQERYLDADGYHWPRHMNLRLFEIILAHVHVDVVER